MNNFSQSISEKSFGEFRGAKEYDKIEDEIRKKRAAEAKKNAPPAPAQHLDVNVLAPFLSHVTQVSNHNLGVATFYQLKLQEAQSLLVTAQETAFNAERKAEHAERKYEIDTEQLKARLNACQNALDATRAELGDYKNRASLFEHTLAENRATIEQKKALIVNLQQSYALKEEETQNLRAQLAQMTENRDNLVNENTQIRLERGELERMEKELETTRRDFEDLLNEERKRVAHFESMMILEVRQKEQVLKDQEPLRQRVDMAEKLMKDAQRAAENQRLENKKLQEQVRTLEARFQERLKEEVSSFQSQNIERIVVLEKALDEARQKMFRFESENERLKIDLSRREGEVAYYVKEYEGMDATVKRTLEERQTYLGEFTRLKTQYELAIENLQKQLLKTQMELVRVQEENKTAHMHIKRQAQKIEDLTQMQAFMNVGDEYVREQVQREAYNEVLREKARATYERKTALIEQEADRILREDLLLKAGGDAVDDVRDDGELEDEWQRLFKNIASVENKLQDNRI